MKQTSFQRFVTEPIPFIIMDKHTGAYGILASPGFKNTNNPVDKLMFKARRYRSFRLFESKASAIKCIGTPRILLGTLLRRKTKRRRMTRVDGKEEEYDLSPNVTPNERLRTTMPSCMLNSRRVHDTYRKNDSSRDIPGRRALINERHSIRWGKSRHAARIQMTQSVFG